MKKRNGVTQTQTLLIMGIVFLFLFACLAVPFYNSYKQKKALSHLMKVYATLIQANRNYAYVTGSNLDEYDTILPINTFAETYFTPYFEIQSYCKGSQSDCWDSPQYVDLKKNKFFNKSLYSIILPDKTVIGFSKNKQHLVTAIIDVDGPVGENKLGKDVFVMYFYNNLQRPDICDKEVYEKYKIKNGIHLGGFDKCGIPQDVYDYNQLSSKNFEDGCNKSSPQNVYGNGVGSACLAFIKASNWTIDKKYPW